MKFRMLMMTERINACVILVREAVGKWQLGRSLICRASLKCSKESNRGEGK
jgi:hypothetical protein